MAGSDAAQRAARLAAKTARNSQTKKKQFNWLFPLGIVVILALGVGLIAFARDKTEAGGSNDVPPRAQLTADQQVFDHWHASYAIDVCGQEVQPLNDAGPDLLGIHTHGDGLVHIHPFSTQAAGKRATMGRFFDQVGIEIKGDKVTLPVEVNGNSSYTSDKDTCGGKVGKWVLAHWKDAREAVNQEKPDQVFEKDFGSIRFSENFGAYTLAFVTEDDMSHIPVPSTAAKIEELGTIDGGSSSSDPVITQAENTPVTVAPTTPGTVAPTTVAAGEEQPTTTGADK